MLIPISGKPGELNLDLIKTAGDADRVLLWLNTVLKDMSQQIVDRGANVDPEWLRKLRAAQRATTNVYHRVMEKRDALTETRAFPEAVLAAVLSFGDNDLLAKIEAHIVENSPHLGGLALIGPDIT